MEQTSVCAGTYGLLEDLISAAIIVDDGADLIRGCIRFDDSELALHALLVFLTVLSLYFLVVLDRLNKLGLDKTSLKSTKSLTPAPQSIDNREWTYLLLANLSVTTAAALSFKCFNSTLQNGAQSAGFVNKCCKLLLILPLRSIVHTVQRTRVQVSDLLNVCIESPDFFLY